MSHTRHDLLPIKSALLVADTRPLRCARLCAGCTSISGSFPLIGICSKTRLVSNLKDQHAIRHHLIASPNMIGVRRGSCRCAIKPQIARRRRAAPIPPGCRCSYRTMQRSITSIWLRNVLKQSSTIDKVGHHDAWSYYLHIAVRHLECAHMNTNG